MTFMRFHLPIRYVYELAACLCGEKWHRLTLKFLRSKPVIKFQLNGIQFDMLFGRAATDTKLREFQQQSPPPMVSQGIGASDQPRREYQIDDSDLVGTVGAGLFFFAS